MAKAAESAYAAIRAGILSGELARGERLREEILAERIGVSRTPVREALRRLNAEGLVDFEPNRGARVAAWSERELEDLYEARALLEGYGARLAASRITEEELDHLAAIASRMSAIAVTDPARADEMTALNGEFHRTIVKASRNAQIDSLVRGLMERPLIYRTFQHYSPERMSASQRHHNELVDALRARDGAWAEALMRAHILAARSTVVESTRAAEDGQADAVHTNMS
ncbi:DNA-binding transcriptional regulator, GntR family [Pseudonocardia thermophila]|uniref:DNA-binding transcriptional regulator, GntR family n=1 Tax=Pseudonocardia thermophila TaxID=1848 RepID=A0A1M6XK23_PSETH|nr:GntR family transcriptional regulator [Pseudonocardia thermophila]SHL06199.1 DNA-binding transcriptional regulator, GntR family [Pseudonocardia thermophila]